MTPTQLTSAQSFLRDLQRHDLALLLDKGTYTMREHRAGYVVGTAPELHVAPVCGDALMSLPDFEKRRVCEAIEHVESIRAGGATGLQNYDVVKDDSIHVSKRVQVLAEVLIQQELMIQVSQGSPSINDVNDYYRARRARLQRDLTGFGLAEPTPFESLWDWYHFWKRETDSYASRARYIKGLFRDTVDKLVQELVVQVPERPATGWDNVDRVVLKARERLEVATSTDDCQEIGLLCREILISLGQAVYDAELHPLIDDKVPTSTDANRMLGGYFAHELGGSSNETVRRHAKASLALALELQHRRTADARLASLCMEATSSVVNLTAILAGRHRGLA